MLLHVFHTVVHLLMKCSENVTFGSGLYLLEINPSVKMEVSIKCFPLHNRKLGSIRGVGSNFSREEGGVVLNVILKKKKVLFARISSLTLYI